MVNNKKTIILLVVLLLGIGFAAVVTTISTTASFKYSYIDDFQTSVTDVIGTSYIGGETSDLAVTYSNNTFVIPSTSFSQSDDYITVSYTFNNLSTYYDANVSLTCTNTGYVSIIPIGITASAISVSAKDSVEASFEIRYSTNATYDVANKVSCSLYTTAVGRTSAAE